MTDYFALLNEPRRPWLDPDTFKQKFIALSATVHPDRVHHLGEAERAGAQEKYVELNAAWSCLREPKDRLRHLLELELGAVPKDIQRIPPDFMDLFMEIGRICREADTLLGEKAVITSPLLKVQFFERSQDGVEKLRRIQEKIIGRRDSLVEALKQLDADWNAVRLPDSTGRSRLLQQTEELYRFFSYFDRWLGQIQERAVKLSF